jgi:hypothetical protein
LRADIDNPNADLALTGFVKFNGILTTKVVGGVANVKAFGALADGVTNNASAFASALAYLKNVGGGVLYLPKGTYRASAMYVSTSNIHIIGDGIGATVFQNAPGVLGGINISNQVANCSIQDLEIDANRRSGATGHGIRAPGGTCVVVKNVKIHNVPGYGIGCQEDGLGTPKKHFRFENVSISDTSMDGIDFKNRTSRTEDVVLENIRVERFQGGGIDVRGVVRMNNIHVSNYSGSSAGIRFRHGVDDGMQGEGGHKSLLTNFYIDSGVDWPTTDVVGLSLGASRVAVLNGIVVNQEYVVVCCMEHCLVQNVKVSACHQYCMTIMTYDPSWTIQDPANYVVVSNCKFVGRTQAPSKGLIVSTDSCIVRNCIFRNHAIALETTGSGSIQNNIFAGNAVDIVGNISPIFDTITGQPNDEEEGVVYDENAPVPNDENAPVP